MNVDQNRDRVKIADFDQKELKRVAFCVDVEIAGYAQQADEEETTPSGNTGTQLKQPASPAMLERQAQLKQKKESKDAKFKDKGEGAALKNPQAASEEKEETGTTKEDVVQAEEATKAAKKAEDAEDAQTPKPAENSTEPPTRKKERKKRSETERK